MPVNAKVRFDFPLILAELVRHRLPCDAIEQALFVDTLAVLQCVSHGCVKLQCQAQRLNVDPGQGHRALDDCWTLRHVATIAAHTLGHALSDLLGRFLLEVDIASSLAQLSVLMDPL